ncbi:MAG: hypothetical protein VW169_03315 [Rhodospirillaceae bacterium]
MEKGKGKYHDHTKLQTNHERLLCTGLALAALSACQTTDSGYHETDSGYYSSARQAAAAQAAATKSEDLASPDYYR